MAASSWGGVLALALGCVVAVNIVKRYSKNKKLTSVCAYPLPPGPAPLPIVGNVRGINVDAPWLTYADWAKTYGDLVYSRLFNIEIVIINSEKVARELLECRSTNYSTRPDLVTNELFGIDFNTVFMQYGDKWRLQRRFTHQSFRVDAASRFRLVQQKAARQLLRNLLKSPDNYREHLYQYTSSALAKVVYDYDPAPEGDGIVDMIERASQLAVENLRPEVAAILSAFPIILRLPSWLPGMKVKQKAALSRKLAIECAELPFQHALRKSNEGSNSPAMVFDALRKVEENTTLDSWTQSLKHASVTAFAAGSETSRAVLMTFFLVMVLYPEAQSKAQAQIDSVCGGSRLPTFDDRPSLTYVDAVLRETLRWAPSNPLSIPHATVDDDVYNGYHIPKGATILANLWAMAHNEEKYPKPFEFIPERFLDADGNLTDDTVLNIGFGFGRRICVGRHFALDLLWSAISTILATFNLSVQKDENGCDISFEPKFATGVATHPLPFPVSIVPRTRGLDAEKLEEIITASVSNEEL